MGKHNNSHDYLEHRSHKYVDRYRDNHGNWQYVYAGDTRNGTSTKKPKPSSDYRSAYAAVTRRSNSSGSGTNGRNANANAYADSYARGYERGQNVRNKVSETVKTAKNTANNAVGKINEAKNKAVGSFNKTVDAVKSTANNAAGSFNKTVNTAKSTVKNTARNYLDAASPYAKDTKKYVADDKRSWHMTFMTREKEDQRRDERWSQGNYHNKKVDQIKNNRKNSSHVGAVSKKLGNEMTPNTAQKVGRAVEKAGTAAGKITRDVHDEVGYAARKAARSVGKTAKNVANNVAVKAESVKGKVASKTSTSNTTKKSNRSYFNRSTIDKGRKRAISVINKNGKRK